MYIADDNNDFQHFSTVPTPTNTIASPPPETMGKYWIQIFITGVPKYELRGLKKTLEAFFYSFLLKSVLNAAFLTLHFNSLIFGSHEKIGNFEIDPKPKIALCGGSVVKLALHFFLAANTIGRHQHKSAAPMHKIPISQWSMFFLFHCCQKPASLICEMVCNTNL